MGEGAYTAAAKWLGDREVLCPTRRFVSAWQFIPLGGIAMLMQPVGAF